LLRQEGTVTLKRFVYLHLPRTGGASLKEVFRSHIDGFYIQANSKEQLERNDPLYGPVRDLDDIRRILGVHNGLALHVDANFKEKRKSTDFRSLAWHFFQPENIEYFKQFTILMMVRHPYSCFLSMYRGVRRLQSRGEFGDLAIDGIEAFLEEMHDNAMLHFLLVENVASRCSFTRRDLERVKRVITEYPIHVGLYERYADSVAHFADVMGFDFHARQVPTLNPGMEGSASSPALKSAFYERSQLDMELYEFVSGLFEQRVGARRRPATRRVD
jgi:hypothetical protein